MFTTAAIDGHACGCNLRAMKRSALALVALLGLTGCESQWSFAFDFFIPAQKPRPFEMDGRTYQWNLMGVGRRANLMLTRLDRADGGPVVLTLSCTDPGYGGLTLGLGDPKDAPLSIQAGAQTFVVDAVREENGAQVRATGESYFPDRWHRALASAQHVVVKHGDQSWTFTGPGRPLSRRFSQFCHGRR